MDNEKKQHNQEQEVPDALGNDKKQGKDMAKAGHGEKVHVKPGQESEHKSKTGEKHNEDDTLGIP